MSCSHESSELSLNAWAQLEACLHLKGAWRRRQGPKFLGIPGQAPVITHEAPLQQQHWSKKGPELRSQRLHAHSMALQRKRAALHCSPAVWLTDYDLGCWQTPDSTRHAADAVAATQIKPGELTAAAEERWQAGQAVAFAELQAEQCRADRWQLSQASTVEPQALQLAHMAELRELLKLLAAQVKAGQLV